MLSNNDLGPICVQYEEEFDWTIRYFKLYDGEETLARDVQYQQYPLAWDDYN